MDLLIKNGTVVTAETTTRADVAVKDGVIAAVGRDLEHPGAKIIDAQGKLVIPGAIDAHVHPAMPFMGTINADDYDHATKAAACGGTTTIFDFAIQTKGENLVAAFERRYALAKPKACIDYAFHTVITDLHPGNVNEIADAVDQGVSSFKVFMVYDMAVDDGVLYMALEKSKECGALIAVHAENNPLVNLLTNRFLSEGKTSPWYHYLTRKEYIEEEAVIRAIHIAKSLDAPLNIVHLSSAGGMKAVTKARRHDQPVFAETCPQYLHFTSDVYKREDGRKWVCSPPIKDQESQDALWAGIERGDVSLVATDHCPFTMEQKDWGLNDFSKIPNGCMGVENMYPYMLGQANSGRISFNKAIELCTINPAKLFGIEETKGTIAPGYDADIVVYDPDKKFSISHTNMHSNTDHTVWEGVEVNGYPVLTLSRGREVYRDGEFVGEFGSGRLIKCKPLHHKTPWI